MERNYEPEEQEESWTDIRPEPEEEDLPPYDLEEPAPMDTPMTSATNENILENELVQDIDKILGTRILRRGYCNELVRSSIGTSNLGRRSNSKASFHYSCLIIMFHSPVSAPVWTPSFIPSNRLQTP